MAKKAFIYSVPGTGTRFTREFVHHCLGYTPATVLDLLDKPPNSRYFGHCHVNNPKAREWTEGRTDLKTVIPLRSPVAMYITRRREMGEGKKAREAAKELWRMLHESLDSYDYVFLPIEETGFSRYNRLVLVSQHLEAGVEPTVFDRIVREWPRIGTSGEKPERLEFDRNGDVEVDGVEVMSFFRSEMRWYQSLIEDYERKLQEKLSTL